MKLQDQVCTIEQAKKLSQLGIRQGLSVFFFNCYPAKPSLIMNNNPEGGYMHSADNTCFSAFTVAELGVMIGTTEWSTNYKKQNIFYWDAELFGLPFGPYSTEAEARAAILIHLLENNLITPAEVNERLK